MPATLRPMADFDLTDPASYTAPELEADLVMKGGITSGLVYPLAASRLATRYRLRSVGGASAGAIAAALTGAAEYRRRHPRPSGPVTDGGAGFLKLTEIPDLMGAKLSSLFVPSVPLRRAYEAFTTWLEPGWGFGKKLRVTLVKVVGGAPLLFALPVVLVVALGTWVAVPLFGVGTASTVTAAVLQLILWLLLGLVIGLVVAALRLVLRTLKDLPANGFGFCNGQPDPASFGTDVPLTPWLTTWLDEVAGLAPGEGPLTFGHLYGAQASQAFRDLQLDTHLAEESPLKLRDFNPEIDLKLMTTCLSWARPYALPFRTRIFHFCPECWKRYFHAPVLEALLAGSSPASLGTQRVNGEQMPISDACVHHPDTKVRVLPSAPDLPVVVGVRMSLSFPVLLSAIPLQAVDYGRQDPHKGLVELWFSDGGITSNFPIHFFDSMLPTRPTFGINLADKHPDTDDMVYLQETNQTRFPRLRPITSVMGLLSSVFNAAQSWVDGMAVLAPGFRDRVVELRTAEGEGGLNLKMEPSTITALGKRGDEAAQEFEDFDFDNHRWIRYRTAMGDLTDLLDRMHRVFPSYRGFVADRAPGASGYRLGSQAASAADLAATEQLMETAGAWAAQDYPAMGGPLPNPRPILRAVPRQ